MEHDVPVIISELRRKGYRLTPQRILIIEEIMRNVKNHISLRELHSNIKAKLPGVSISTVHQTLKILEEMGFIKLFEVDGKLHVDKPGVHVNVVCRDTGDIVDIDGELAKIIDILRQKGLEPVNILVEARCHKNFHSRVDQPRQ